ncbi:hypothetical protein HYT84_02060 [Candidatus Micrarchaeota archaeon]|nr:hypothetical protein [Candidatus Micrarchaeota archaeon]
MSSPISAKAAKLVDAVVKFNGLNGHRLPLVDRDALTSLISPPGSGSDLFTLPLSLVRRARQLEAKVDSLTRRLEAGPDAVDTEAIKIELDLLNEIANPNQAR